MKRLFFLFFLGGLFFSPLIEASADFASVLNSAVREYKRGNPAAALTLIERGTYSQVSARQKSEAGFLMADCLVETGRLNEAREICRRILDEGSESDAPAALWGIARSYQLEGDDSQALSTLSELTALFPSGSFGASAQKFLRNPKNKIHSIISLRPIQVEPAAPYQITPKAPGSKREISALQKEHKESVSRTYSSPPEKKLPENEQPFFLSSSEPSEDINKNGKIVETLPGGEYLKEESSGQGAVLEVSGESSKGNEIENGENSMVIMQAGAFFTDQRGNITAKGMDLDLKPETDFSTKAHPAIEMAYRFSKNFQLGLTYQQNNFSGNLANKITFASLDYDAGSGIRIDNSLLSGEIRHIVKFGPDTEAGLLVGMVKRKSELKLEQQLATGLRRGFFEQNLDFPFGGVHGRNRLTDSVWVDGKFQYMTKSGDDDGIDFHDAEVALLVNLYNSGDAPDSGIFGRIGYRDYLVKGRTNQETADIRFSGPTLSLQSRF